MSLFVFQILACGNIFQGNKHTFLKGSEGMLSKITSCLILLVCIVCSYGQVRDEDGYTADDVKAKVAKFKNLQITGLTLLGLGVTSTIVGISLMSSADWESNSTPTGTSMTTHDSKGGVGIVMLGLGIPITIAGTILSTIGTKKHREYKSRLNVFSYYNPNTKKIAASLTYGF